MTTNPKPDIEELIEASSLGTPDAKAHRASVSDATIQRVLARARELENQATVQLPMTDLTREQTILALRIMITKLNEAIQSNTWTLETARILELAQDIGAYLESRPTPHHPARGSDIEAWIKRRRNQCAVNGSPEWYAIDALLDDYRDHADTGTSLDRGVRGPHGED